MDSRLSQETSREDGEQVEAQYEGEDVRLTSQKELSGWYSYGFAAEVFAICAMGKPLYHIQTTYNPDIQARSPQTSCMSRNKRVRLVLL
jgi:MFS transporter, UMF1 family